MKNNTEELTYNELQKLASKLGIESVIGVKGDDLKKYIKENQVNIIKSDEIESTEIKSIEIEPVETKVEDTDIVPETEEIDEKTDEKEVIEAQEEVKELKIAVTREGREGIFLPEVESLISWIKNKNFDSIHHMYAGNHMILGADWDIDSAVERIRIAEKIGLLMSEVSGGNLGHALAVVYQNKLNIMDIGVVTEEDLDIKD